MVGTIIAGGLVLLIAGMAECLPAVGSEMKHGQIGRVEYSDPEVGTIAFNNQYCWDGGVDNRISL